MAGPHRILVVEDDVRVGAGVARALRAAGFEVELEVDLEPARTRLLQSPPIDLLVLDLNLPGGDGMDLLESAAGAMTRPVLVLTARVDVHTRLRVFENGAVDYLAKPFFTEELVARVRARLCLPMLTEQTRIAWGPVELDVSGRRVLIDGADAGFTRVELDLLLFLHARRGRAVARDELAARVLPAGDDASSRTVDAHVTRIRQKLGEGARAVVTVWGIGYRFDPDTP